MKNKKIKPLEYYLNSDEYFVVDIPGKHGEIHLSVPKREPTEEEIKNFHRNMAKVLMKEYKTKQREKREKG